MRYPLWICQDSPRPSTSAAAEASGAGASNAIVDTSQQLQTPPERITPITMASSTTASQAELMEARIPLHWRDQCSALLIPLNKCRHRENYLPWKCEDERHEYEKCQYRDFLRRARVLEKQKAEAAAPADDD